VVGLCIRFACLPEAGGLLDQDAQIMRLLAVYDLAYAEPNRPTEVITDYE
jgi:hypothetical protein